ncbi:Tat pathway signal protein [Rhodococcus sp. HNM0569]|uniref:Tat pathway signal protein n=1 Tax=Rhodococcus sp. HNM0569 TaxID=2716340 RepID=UPI00146DA63C|nr:Tat pathway signal protein [Rhodococcus sp. HNM0569]NLU82758.1 Tat pathway signal protein [Rhodococcus sp. HNM0569]
MKKLVFAAFTAFAVVAAPAAHAQPAADGDVDYLDVPRANETSEGNGGVVPSFSNDPEVLRPVLDAARERGVEPARYAGLLHQYWLTEATRAAGLDLANWDPTRGLAANEQNLAKVFTYYEKLQRENPDFLWTGQGGMAGPSFAAGIMDIDLGRVVLGVHEIRDVVAEIVQRVNDVAAPATANLPSDVQAVLDVGGSITAEDIAEFQVRVIAMNKHIFTDLIPQHQAYLGGGMAAIDEYHAAGLIDDAAYSAWQDIATGEPDKIVDGNAQLLYREQNQAIADQWDAASSMRQPVGRALTYVSTIAADPAIPGLVPPREASPLTLVASDLGGAEVDGPQWHLQTPLPAFNWADRDGRWAYITEHMLPTYRALKEQHPDQWMAALSKPMDQQILEQRALVRLPQMLRSMASVTQAQFY